MKFNDTFAGLLILIFGLAVIACARTFPPMPGQNVGPSLFPALIGGGFVLFAAALIFSGLRRRGTPWIEIDEWVRRPRMLLNFALVIGALVFYALAVDALGFFITGILFLCALLAAFGVRHRLILPVAVLVTAAIHYGFYTLLRVPLPWGLLEGIAW